MHGKSGHISCRWYRSSDIDQFGYHKYLSSISLQPQLTLIDHKLHITLIIIASAIISRTVLFTSFLERVDDHHLGLCHLCGGLPYYEGISSNKSFCRLRLRQRKERKWSQILQLAVQNLWNKVKAFALLGENTSPKWSFTLTVYNGSQVDPRSLPYLSRSEETHWPWRALALSQNEVPWDRRSRLSKSHYT